MGKRWKKRFRGVCCWKGRVSSDSESDDEDLDKKEQQSLKLSKPRYRQLSQMEQMRLEFEEIDRVWRVFGPKPLTSLVHVSLSSELPSISSTRGQLLVLKLPITLNQLRSVFGPKPLTSHVHVSLTSGLSSIPSTRGQRLVLNVKLPKTVNQLRPVFGSKPLTSHTSLNRDLALIAPTSQQLLKLPTTLKLRPEFGSKPPVSRVSPTSELPLIVQKRRQFLTTPLVYLAQLTAQKAAEEDDEDDDEKIIKKQLAWTDIHGDEASQTTSFDINRLVTGETAIPINGHFGADDTSSTHDETSLLIPKEETSCDSEGLSNLHSPVPVVSEVSTHLAPPTKFKRHVKPNELTCSLQELMDKGVALDESHAKFVCINLIDIQRYLLKKGVIHTDINPRKIVLDELGYPCLNGYEHSIYTGSDLRSRRKFRPPIEYCSPEQAMKVYVTEASDVFQTGVLCYNMIYGRPPHQGSTYQETRNNILNTNFIPKFTPDGLLSRDGKFFLVSCIRKDLEKRFSVKNCGKSLVNSIKWFNDYDEKTLNKHTFVSPFLQFLKK